MSTDLGTAQAGSADTRSRKREWQRRDREIFKEQYGYSKTSHYGAGGMREEVLIRDDRRCVRCGMSDVEHKEKYGRPITIDHKSKDRSDNSMENLQTLCLSCHGRKDLLPGLQVQRIPIFRAEITERRGKGDTYQRIADDLGFSIAGVWKWCKRWEAGSK